MLASSGNFSAGSLCFWHQPVSKEFSQPQYFIGELALHVMRVPKGYVLHLVKVVGAYWTGIDWQYAIELPTDHPYYKKLDGEFEWVDEVYLEKL